MATTVDQVPEHLVVDFDIHDQSNAGPVDQVPEKVSALRAKGPVVYSTAHGGHWIVTGYEEAHAVLRDAQTFSSFPNNLLQQGTDRFIPLEIDPPQHTAFRHALQPLFNPKRMRELEPKIRELTGKLLDGFAGRGRCEFISEFAHELPTQMFLALMGWPVEDAPMFTESVDTILVGKPGATDEESDAAKAEAGQRLYGYFGEVVAKRRAETLDPEQDVTSAVMNTPIEIDCEERLLTDPELFSMFFLLLIAGLHTVQGTLAWSMMYLAERPEQRQRIIDDPESIPQAVEELLRIEAAISMGRRATKDVDLGGVHLKEGDQMVVILSGVNRDPSQFDAPTELQLDRSPNRHLSFGAGPHRCLGSHLARVELAIALAEIHQRIPDYRLEADNPPISHASQVRGVAVLPLEFTAEAQAPAA
ncbi:cytochrome P450 [Actinomycetospora sp. TBRC 11914]|nr:cytochrome P450 [Actinomycetospora sp. TBRC 11914]